MLQEDEGRQDKAIEILEDVTVDRRVVIREDRTTIQLQKANEGDFMAVVLQEVTEIDLDKIVRIVIVVIIVIRKEKAVIGVVMVNFRKTTIRIKHEIVV